MQRIDTCSLIVAVLFLIAGCTTSPHRLNVVATTGQGEPIDVTTREVMSRESIEPLAREIVAAIEQRAPESEGRKQVLIYIHGGLKGLSSSLNAANTLVPRIESAGYYPLFIIWPSNLTRTYFEQLFLIRQGHRSPVLGPLTFPFVLLGDLAEGLVRAPGTMAQQFKTGVSTWGPRILRPQTNARRRERDLLESTEDPLRVISGDNDVGWAAKAGYSFLYLLTLVPKLVTAPLIDGFGQPAYVNMNRRTDTMFRRTAEFEKEFNDAATDPAELATYDGGSGAMARLFRALEICCERSSRVEITLVGHSMGTIVANRILRYYPKLPVRRAIYMAAACTIQDFRDSVVPFMRTHPRMEFFNLTLHPFSEASEAQWAFLDLTPRGSLLEWIDNFLTNPTTDADRTLGKWDNIMLASHLIPVDLRERVVLKSFGAGRRGEPQKHGDFDEYDFWTPEYRGEISSEPADSAHEPSAHGIGGGASAGPLLESRAVGETSG